MRHSPFDIRRQESEVEPHPRYEIRDKIGAGDFAAVFRAVDRELGREVAVKQIHQQFLADEKQLDRFWREAQLLASLQHPNIMTIYDIVRPRGWLIMELMQGNWPERLKGQPMNLDSLRFAIGYCLRALKFLHSNSIIHGDVKPTNMLVDKRNRTKLGDFGLARRVANDEGSLLKGTTKYMAPEVVSDQFGAVGPASDLYSLGFSAYELMCGSHFESLFPGLAAFGRDRQIAWMMWHTAADRRLPEIPRVLEGVPEELAAVIHKLTEKDQAKRYKTADEALADLKLDPFAVQASRDQTKEEKEQGASAARRKRLLAIGAFAGSAVLSIAMLFVPGSSPAVSKTQRISEPVQGVVREVVDQVVVLEVGPEARIKEVTVPPDAEIKLNKKRFIRRAELKSGDRVTVTHGTKNGRRFTEITATRAERMLGRIEHLQPDLGSFDLRIETGDDQGQTIKVHLPATVKVRLNGRDALDGHPIRLADLEANDRVEADVIEGEDGAGPQAVTLAATRLARLAGTITEFDSVKGTIALAVSDDGRDHVEKLSITDDAAVTLNGRRALAGKTIRPGDLKIGDQVVVEHDTHARRVEAQRVFTDTGVVRRHREDPDALEVAVDGRPAPTMFLVPREVDVQIAGEAVQFIDLRVNDRVKISHDSPDGENPRVAKIEATRPADPRRWAAVIGVGRYDDQNIMTLKFAVRDAEQLRDRLVKRAGFDPDHALLVPDASRIVLEQKLAGLLGQVGRDDQLVVYFAGHTFVDPQTKEPFLAPRDFSLSRVATSGLSLKSLLEQLEKCPASEKLLLLDGCHEETGAAANQQPSSSELVDSVKPAGANAVSKTVSIIASCEKNQRGLNWEEKKASVFGACLADAFAGRADKNRDTRFDAREVFDHVRVLMATHPGRDGVRQSPSLFLPDTTPPRISAEARAAILALLRQLDREKPDPAESKGLFDAASNAAPNEPEPKLAYALVLLKAGGDKNRDDALDRFTDVRSAQPDSLLPHAASAWIHTDKGNYESGMKSLLDFLTRLPRTEKPLAAPDDAISIYEWAGRLRAFAATSKEKDAKRPSDATLEQIETLVAKHGPEAEDLFRKGRDAVRRDMENIEEEIARLEKEMAKTTNPSDRLLISNDLQKRKPKRKLANNVKFDVGPASLGVKSSLDR